VTGPTPSSESSPSPSARLAVPTRLAERHETLRFASGDEVLDGWLRHRAAAVGQEEGTSTFVVAQGSRVVGYYSLARAAVERTQVSRWRSRRTVVDPVPALAIGRLAVDVNFRGRGVGARLLRDAVMRSATVYRTVGLPLLVAHAIEDERKSFYRHFGFVDTRLDPYLVVLPLKAAVGRPGR
jgi:ribosomal protein S18 acetylase RimI-like enzyme